MMLNRDNEMAALATTAENVLHVTELSTNVLSMAQLVVNDNRVKFYNDGCRTFQKNGNFIGIADLVHNMYKLRTCTRILMHLHS